MHMVIVGFLSWWYGAGWRERLSMIGARLLRIFDFFSLDLLIKTWFSPFRQIGTGQAARGIGEQFRAFLDQLVSRVIGGIVRTIMLVVGVIVLLLSALIGAVEAVLWAMVPFFPIAGVLLFAIGWVPNVGF